MFFIYLFIKCFFYVEIVSGDLDMLHLVLQICELY